MTGVRHLAAVLAMGTALSGCFGPEDRRPGLHLRGKVDAMSIPMLETLHGAFERADRDGAVVVLTGREGIFSAGFDLKVFPQGREPTVRMLRLGATLSASMSSFQRTS